jgi:hypothetical protein
MPSENDIEPRILLRMLETTLDPETQKCIEAIRLAADCDIPQEQASSFLRFHAFITSPQPRYITAWRQDHNTEQWWYRRHVDGILSHVRGALAAAHYHANRLGEIEASVNAVLARTAVRQSLENSTMGFGCTRKMDIEYQGFVLAYRRCLDYLAHSLAGYFMQEVSSFRTFPKSIAKTKSPEVATALTEAHARHASQLKFVLAEGRRSVRNRIAHYEFVSAGCVNLTAKGFFLVGGGEEVPMPENPNGVNLNAALYGRLRVLHACVDDMIDTFVQAARTDQRSNGPKRKGGP